nr:TIGR04211 family SH3 domain-containing protein [Gammaproteobacteria bacterium]
MLRLAALVCLSLISLAGYGQSRYVTDDVRIELRAGPSLEYRILRYLSSGTRVDVLGSDEDAGYTRVRVVDGGEEGWVLSRYLQTEPIARERLRVAERNLEQARARVSELEAEVARLTQELTQTRTELETATARGADAAKELADIRAASANVIAIRDENEQLKRHIAEAERRINRLVMENTELQSDSRQDWFLAGAGVLLAGILIGLIAPSLRRKRRSSW